MTAPVRSAAALLALVLGALVSTVLLAAPAQAAEQVITITADGVSPKVLQVRAGDTIRFVAEDRTFAYRAQSTSDNWSFDSGPVGLLDGDYVVEDAVTESGTYTYRVAQDEPFAGSVVLPSATRPAPSTAGPRPATSPRPAASPAASPTGGEGTAATPPLGGFGTVDTPPSPAATGGGGVALPPALAPPLGAGESPAPAQAPATAPEPSAAAQALPAVPGDLAGAPSPRGLGLPAALAVVLAAGTASLLVRLLLAEPVARRALVPTATPATVD